MSVAIAIEMNNIRFQAIAEIEQPLARRVDLCPRLLHPLEFVVALKKPQVIELGNLVTLLVRWQRAHYREANLNALRSKGACKFERVIPNTADSVGGHQDPGREQCHLVVSTN